LPGSSVSKSKRVSSRLVSGPQTLLDRCHYRFQVGSRYTHQQTLISIKLDQWCGLFVINL
jgi:hypothetical protein